MKSELAKLNRKLQGINNVKVRKFLVRYWLEYHFVDGEILNYRRIVAECKSDDNKHCNRGREDCVCLVHFKNYNWCIAI